MAITRNEPVKKTDLATVLEKMLNQISLFPWIQSSIKYVSIAEKVTSGITLSAEETDFIKNIDTTKLPEVAKQARDALVSIIEKIRSNNNKQVDDKAKELKGIVDSEGETLIQKI